MPMRPSASPRLIGGRENRCAVPPPSEPYRQFSRIKCGAPHLMRYVAKPLMWLPDREAVLYWVLAEVYAT